MDDHHIPASAANRFGYACGRALKRGYQRLRALESRLGEHAENAGVPAGKSLVRCGFVVALLALIGVLFLLSVLVGSLLISVTAAIIYLKTLSLTEPSSSKEDSQPDYLGADLYIGDYDDNGHYIGHCKSSRFHD